MRFNFHLPTRLLVRAFFASEIESELVNVKHMTLFIAFIPIQSEGAAPRDARQK